MRIFKIRFALHGSLSNWEAYNLAKDLLLSGLLYLSICAINEEPHMK